MFGFHIYKSKICFCDEKITQRLAYMPIWNQMELHGIT